MIWSSSSINGGVPQLGCCGGGNAWLRINQITATVQYSVQAFLLNANGGVVGPIACGSSVPQGSRVALTFVPHQDQDISWFRTGHASDSPYGIWIPNATRSYPNACTDPQYYLLTSPNGNKVYARLIGSPPSETITGLPASCSSYGTNGADRVCTVNSSIDANFTFASTFGLFYADEAYHGCSPYQGGAPLNSQTAKPYQLPIGQETISCHITAVPAPQAPPTSPTVSGAGAGNAVGGTGVCTTNVPYTITMTAVDPNADTLRYGVDWDGNGTVDQFVPTSGYVPSGTSQSVSRTFSTDGAKSIKVFAQNSHGLISGWTSYSVTCSPAQQNAATSTAIYTSGNNNGAGIGSVSPALSLRAIPSLVSPGKTSNINWSATNVASCTVSGDNGDSWKGTVSPVGGETSAPITKKTVYTLTCRTIGGKTLTANATVNILPTWVEQ